VTDKAGGNADFLINSHLRRVAGAVWPEGESSTVSSLGLSVAAIKPSLCTTRPWVSSLSGSFNQAVGKIVDRDIILLLRRINV
jgi:hypothetical protein